ncbi:MAG TPA: hypothetical protein VEL07_16500 [Planctomycetota bacterium]|nr:hypothetical protein [Planctomycetota bacterium]
MSGDPIASGSRRQLEAQLCAALDTHSYGTAVRVLCALEPLVTDEERADFLAYRRRMRMAWFVQLGAGAAVMVP